MSSKGKPTAWTQERVSAVQSSDSAKHSGQQPSKSAGGFGARAQSSFAKYSQGKGPVGSGNKK